MCGETKLNGIKGTIKSPKFPRKYPNDQQCRWIIKAPVEHRIVIRFVNFNLEGSSKCSFDYLVVKDGEYDNSKTIGRYCGSDKPVTITTSNNTANLKFKSDTSVVRRGFLIRWKAVYPLTATPTAFVQTTATTTTTEKRPEAGGNYDTNSLINMYRWNLYFHVVILTKMTSQFKPEVKLFLPSHFHIVFDVVSCFPNLSNYLNGHSILVISNFYSNPCAPVILSSYIKYPI